MFREKKFWLGVITCLLAFSTSCAYAQQRVYEINMRDYNTLHEVTLIDSVWYFHPDDGMASRQPVLSTLGWDTLRHTGFGKSEVPKGWRGVGWFGLWVKAGAGLVNKKLAFRINHDGASEIFIDGKPIGGYGKVGSSAAQMEAVRAPRGLIPIWFSDSKPHLITIHYSNFSGVYPNFFGFQVWIGDYQLKSKRIAKNDLLFSFVPIFAAAEIILGLLHLLLFAFYPARKLNLNYAIFVLLVGVNSFGVYLYYHTSSPYIQYYADLLTSLGKVLLMCFGTTLLYALDYGRIPRLRLICLSVVTLYYLVYYLATFIYFPFHPSNDYFSLVFFGFTIDSFWSAVRLIKKKQKDVWLIILGVVAVTSVYFFAWADVFLIWPYELNAMRVFVMSAGNLILPFCLSLYLALDFARTNQHLKVKLAEVEDLSSQALAREAEKIALIAEEAKRLESLVLLRTVELSEKADRLKETDIVKSRFFTNITHEFKTPLTLIINPAKELLAKATDGEAVNYLRHILSNATRLLQLINQLLDISKLESGLMIATPAPLDLVALIKAHINAYQSIAIQKGIELRYVSGPAPLWILGDSGKLDQIVLNLLSNALKFTDNGRAEVFLQQNVNNNSSSFILTVRDTGQGIPTEKLPYLFTRFYQADPSDTRSAEGTGIGLALVKELVELMGGAVTIKSVQGLFTEATVEMPYQPCEVPNTYLQETLMPTPSPAINVNDSGAALTLADDGKPLLLLIEDNDELRSFMGQTLGAGYHVLSTSDGINGLTIAQEKIPNLIITDLMMPGLDGYQLSRELKNDARTSHIPIIMLTAKAGMESRVQGIATGADAYLEKPYDQRELLALIENLINTRGQLREIYSKIGPGSKETLFMPSIEQDFIARVRTAIELHLNEEGYSADQLALDLGLSRTQLHRKLKAIIGQAPGELIRIVRLQYAHDLLERRAATVSEVAYMVGFSSPASFSASFSRHFGFPPKTVNPL
jgi:signal transduction histidine kinase/DNA-binding response OmpR family regulator